MGDAADGWPSIPDLRVGRQRIVVAARLGVAYGITRLAFVPVLAYGGVDPLDLALQIVATGSIVVLSLVVLGSAHTGLTHRRMAMLGSLAAAQIAVAVAIAAGHGALLAPGAIVEVGVSCAITCVAPMFLALPDRWLRRATPFGLVPPLVAIGVFQAGTHAWPESWSAVAAALLAAATIAAYRSVVWARGAFDGPASGGVRLGGYVLQERLGEGAMGEVWRATHHHLSRLVAMKLMSPQMLEKLDPDDAERVKRRFEREAQATARLTSPNAVRLYDFGVEPDGSFYYAMELLDGVDLETLVRRFGRQPPERVAHVVLQACHALDDAHTQGLVHRDVKPANLFLSRQGRDVDVVKVLDFGLVALMGDVKLNPARAGGPSGKTILTLENVVVGSPAYIAPERLLGTGADHRADLYAVACVAYWLLTGRRVFSAVDVPGQVAAHVGEVPERAGSFAEVPPALDALILRGLAKDPAERPQSAWELAEAVRELGLAEAWTAERARAWWAEHLPKERPPRRPRSR